MQIFIYGIAGYVIADVLKGLKQATEHNTGLYILLILCIGMIMGIAYVCWVYDLRWIETITLTESRIITRKGYKKIKIYTYDYFKCISAACYVHSLVGSPDFGPIINYIIFSVRKISEQEKVNANKLGKNSEQLRVKYTKRHYRYLMEFLPVQKRKELEIIVHPELTQPGYHPPKKRVKEKRKKK